jgi:signal transduction histidine kinase
VSGEVSGGPSRRWWPLSGVRGRVVLTVLVVTACLYSLLGTIGFLYIADGGRDSIRERVTGVVDQLEAGLRAGTGVVSLLTPDGVEANAVDTDAPPPLPTGDVTVTRTITIGSRSYLLVGHASQAPLTDSLRSLHTGLWIGVPLAVLVTALVAGLATRRALRPVSVITEQAAAIDAHDVSTRVPVPDTDDEVEHLARTVNDMLDRIAAGQRAQRQFTSDAAHELRTPLMALLGELELARRSPGPPDPQLLARLDDLAQRLARRVDDLVLLSTLDEQPPLHRQPTDLLEVVRTEAAAVAVGDPAPAIAVLGHETTAVVDERLLSRAVRNLLSNACRHAAANVQAEVDANGDRVWVHIDDDGPGVPAADRELVLRRFGRLDQARQVDSGGAGLGLAIAASVARAHGGDVVVSDADLGGARISLWVPAA